MLIQFGCKAALRSVDPKIQLTHLGQIRIADSMGRALRLQGARRTRYLRCSQLPSACVLPLVGGSFAAYSVPIGCLGEGDADREVATSNLTRCLLSVLATLIVGPSLTQGSLQ